MISSIFLKGPFFMRYCTTRSAVFGPMPGSDRDLRGGGAVEVDDLGGDDGGGDRGLRGALRDERRRDEDQSGDEHER